MRWLTKRAALAFEDLARVEYRTLIEALPDPRSSSRPAAGHSTVTDLARLRGWSISQPRSMAT